MNEERRIYLCAKAQIILDGVGGKGQIVGHLHPDDMNRVYEEYVLMTIRMLNDVYEQGRIEVIREARTSSEN